jgi:hypothetical protein
MLLGFLERTPQMMRVWGDVREYEPSRIRLDNCCAEERLLGRAGGGRATS